MTSREQVSLEEERIAARTSSRDAGVNSVKILGGSEGIGCRQRQEYWGILEQRIEILSPKNYRKGQARREGEL